MRNRSKPRPIIPSTNNPNNATRPSPPLPASPEGQIAPAQPARKGALNANIVDFISHSANQTHKVGVVLGRLAMPGDIILLVGELGAGKTTLTKGIAEGLGIEGYVNSPTFTLVNEYEGRIPLYHLDCYRLESGREALDFGLEEYLYGDGLTVIEWPERIAEVLPDEVLTVRLSHLNETKRGIRLEPVGQRYISMATDFKKQAFGITN